MGSVTTKRGKRLAKPARLLKPADAKWVKTRRALLRQVKAEVQKRLGGRSPQDITEFSVRYERALKKAWKISSQDELVRRIEESDLVYGGDFHALAQAQRTHLRLLRRIQKPVVLALESFQAASQKHLDAFISGDLSLEDLRAKSKWDQTWGFSWDHYRPLLELAKARGFRLLALNSKIGSRKLEARETKAARLIARNVGAGHLLYVIFGDLHLAPSHLPLKVEKQLALTRSKPRPRALTVHLNSERVYFQLASRGLETDVDVVKFSDSSFCVLSTPPWVKWQSYLLFLDRAGAFDHDERLDDETDFDPTDQVALLVRLAADDLGLAKDFRRINDLAVYGEDDGTIWREVAKRTSKFERATAESLLRTGQRFFLPDGGIAYQPKPTINSAASLAGLYLHARLSKRRESLWNFPSDIRANVWIEAVSYLISKMVNHSRRSETLAGLQTKLRSRTGSENAEALRLALDVRLSELARVRSGKRRPLQIQPRRRSSYVEASRILGGMLGERLYVAYRSRKLKKETLIAWLKHDPGSRSFLDLYYEIVDGIVERAVGR
jgi:hypothetical protein